MYMKGLAITARFAGFRVECCCAPGCPDIDYAGKIVQMILLGTWARAEPWSILHCCIAQKVDMKIQQLHVALWYIHRPLRNYLSQLWGLYAYMYIHTHIYIYNMSSCIESLGEGCRFEVIRARAKPDHLKNASLRGRGPSTQTQCTYMHIFIYTCIYTYASSCTYMHTHT